MLPANAIRLPTSEISNSHYSLGKNILDFWGRVRHSFSRQEAICAQQIVRSKRDNFIQLAEARVNKKPMTSANIYMRALRANPSRVAIGFCVLSLLAGTSVFGQQQVDTATQINHNLRLTTSGTHMSVIIDPIIEKSLQEKKGAAPTGRRPVQLIATSFSARHCSQRTRRKPSSRRPHCR
jgi:hypothetical protein